MEIHFALAFGFGRWQDQRIDSLSARARDFGAIRIEVGGVAWDAALAERAEQFRAIMLPHMDAAYSLARYLTRDPVVAEDIVQEAFLSAFRGFDRWRGNAAKAWLLAIVRNCVHARNRHWDVAMPIEDASEPSHEDPTPEEVLIGRHALASLRQEIDALAPAFREILILRELEELSYQEIASIIDIPIGTVMSRLSRARQMLRSRLVALHLADSGAHA